MSGIKHWVTHQPIPTLFSLSPLLQTTDSSREVALGLFWSGPNQPTKNRQSCLTSIQSTHYAGYSAHHTISLAGNPYIVAACYFPDYTLYVASTLDGHGLLWEPDAGLSYHLQMVPCEKNMLRTRTHSPGFAANTNFTHLREPTERLYRARQLYFKTQTI